MKKIGQNSKSWTMDKIEKLHKIENVDKIEIIDKMDQLWTKLINSD